MSGAKVGYVEEAGNAKLAQEMVSKTLAAQHVLKDLCLTTTVTGQQVLNEWLAAAAALGARVQAQSAVVPDTDPEAGLKVLKAPQAWISIVRAVLAVLDHTSAPADKVAANRKPVEDLEAKATARAIARISSGQPVPVGPTG